MNDMRGDGLQPESILQRRSDVRFRVIEDEGVVVRQTAAEVLVLNDTATRILALADGAASLGCWVDMLLDEYDVERATLEKDVLAFAAELLAQGLLEPVNAVRAGPREAGG
jgi:hypothetical protein